MSAALGRLAARSRPGLDPRLRSRSLASYADARLHLAALSLVAGAIHALVAAPHFGEYWLFGSFFIVIALFQFAWGAQAYRAPSSGLYRVGICVSLGVVALWLVSRTVGVPLGPDSGTPEAVGPLDAVCSAIELGIAGLSLAFVHPERRLPAPVWLVRGLALALMSAGLLLMVLGAHQH